MKFIEHLFNTPRQRAIASCIAFNLLLGNSIIYFMNPHYSVNYPLMLVASVSCVACYLILFRYLRPGLNKIVLGLISIATCMAIVFIGAALTMLYTALHSGVHSLGDWLALPFTMLFSSILGSVIMFPFALVMGLVNYFWIIEVEKRTPNNRITE